MNHVETVRLTDVSIGYRTRQGVRTVAQSITAALQQGELTCLLGPNGVGKSTLLRTLSAFQPCLGGTISVDDRPLQDYSAKELAQHIGVVLTERPDVQQMTVWQMVAMGRSPYTGFWGSLHADDERVVNEAISQVGIAPLAERQVATLSDGERQKVMIAKALAQQTAVIFLDEPTAFLDYPSKVDILLLLRRICHDQQHTVLLSTHDIELAMQVADTLWLLQKDGALAIGSPRSLADDGVLRRFVEDGSQVVFDEDTFSIHVKKSAV